MGGISSITTIFKGAGDDHPYGSVGKRGGGGGIIIMIFL